MSDERKFQIIRSNEYFALRKREYGLEKWMGPKVAVQRLRFERVEELLRPYDSDSWLDVGCGTGDFLQYLREGAPREYHGEYLGIDVYPEVVGFAKERFAEDRLAKFIVRDVLGDVVSWGKIHIHDWVVILGVFARRDCSLSYADKMFLDLMDFAYRACERGCAITFHSTYMTECNENEMAFDPAWVFQQARRITERVVIDHSYAPHDFMLCMFKKKSPFRIHWEEDGGWNSESGE